MKNIYINRDRNVITRENTLESLHTFKNFPIYIGCTDKDQKYDITGDLSVAICKKTGIIQLDKVLPLEVIYGDYHSEALGGLWNEHHNQFVSFLNSYSPVNVLEIGGSNGYIAKEATRKNKLIQQWIMVEPAPAYEGDERIKIVPKSFDEKFKYDGDVNCIVHSHTFEHIYEPSIFMKNIGEFTKEGDMQIFSVPNLYKYLVNMQANWINFEHNVFLSEDYIDYLLAINGFEILEKKYFYEHSIFYAARKNKMGVKHTNLPNKYLENKKLFQNYLKYNTTLVKKFTQEISKTNNHVYLFGAHIFSQNLLMMGLKGEISGVLDNSKLKEGKRLYGTNLKVFNPNVIRGKENVTVILRAGAYQDEVKKQLYSLNSTIQILE